MILKSIRRWLANHRWVDVRDNYIIPHKNTTFWLTDYSVKEARKFMTEHPSRFYTYMFTPGPIGVCIKIKGGEIEEDITDYKSW